MAACPSCHRGKRPGRRWPPDVRGRQADELRQRRRRHLLTPQQLKRECAARLELRRIDLSQVRIVLVDGLPRVLSAYSERLSGKAAAELRRLGVEIHLGVLV